MGMRTTIRTAIWVLLTILPAVSYTSGRTRFKSSAPTSADIVAETSSSISVTGQTAGTTPFIVNVQLLANPPASVQSIKFSIAPKPGSVTRPVAATYFADYLQSRGYLDPQTGSITIPVFGLYSNFSNTVNLTCCFSDGTSQQVGVNIITPPYTDPCGHDTPTVLQARTSAALSYDFMFVRAACNGTQGPFIIDSDGAIRWVGNIGQANIVSGFFDNAIYMTTKPASSTLFTALSRLELDGTFTQVADYAGLNPAVIGLHHNLDVGREGILVAVDTTAQIEATIFEVNLKGQILRTWNIDQIISAAMTAGGDDPTQFVKPNPTDWFHNNAATYRASDNTLVVSGREDFVIALDYDTGAIKWILGDSTKKWYQFQSLRNFALTLAPGSLPPIGQHAVSFSYDDNLLLFDNGEKSASPSNVPAGDDRTYNAPRKYRLDLQNKIATEVWNYPMGQAFDSRFCSSVYEDAPYNFVIDYAIISNLGGPQLSELIGLSPNGDKVFEYRYLASGCAAAYNSLPLHWENLVFTGPAENPLHIIGISVKGLNRIFTFQAVAGNTYQLQYKNSLTDPNWLSLATNLTPGCSGPAQLSDLGIGTATRYYRVRQVPPSTPPVNPVSVNDTVLGTGNNQWDYSAGWNYILVGPPSPGFLQDEHYSAITNNTVHFRFNGTQVKIYTVKEPPGGNIGYSLDGAGEQIISNYAPATTGNALSYTSPVVSAGNHDLVIRVVGTHEAAATSNTITVDRAEVFQ